MDWYWEHDIQPDQVNRTAVDGMRLARLSEYGGRYAAVYHAGTPTTHRLDLDATEIPPYPVAITVAAGPLFAVVLDPNAPSRAYVDVDENTLRDFTTGVADVATYTVGGARRYAIVIDDRIGERRILTGVTEGQLGRERGDVVRLRAYTEYGRRLYTAVLGPRTKAFAKWYADLTGDQVSGRLERSDAFPYDLDATRDERGVRFTVVMRRWNDPAR